MPALAYCRSRDFRFASAIIIHTAEPGLATADVSAVMPTANFAFLEIAGPPCQHGRAYGEGLRALIGERDRRWRHEIETYAKVSADAFIETFLQ
jgi:hypothetical protein